MTRNMLQSISGYSEDIDLRYYAAAYSDRQKLSKTQERQFQQDSLDEIFFRIKKKPRFLNYDLYISDRNNASCPNALETINESYDYNHHVNLLNMGQLFLLRGSIKLSFKYLRLFFSNPERSIDVSHELCKNAELLDFVKSYDKYESEKTQKNGQIRVSYEEMLSSILTVSKKFAFRLSSWVLNSVVAVSYFFSTRLMERLIVSAGEIDRVRKFNERNVPIVYVLEEQSHTDWFIVLFTLILLKLKVPVSFLYENLNFRFLKWILRKCGVIFMRPPPLEIYESDTKRRIGDEAWLVFVEELIRVNNHFILHLKAPDGYTDSYIFKAIADSIKRMTTEDVIIVPVDINQERNYEKFPPRRWRESSFWSKLLDVFKHRKCSSGFVKISFLEPFSLKDLMNSHLEENENLLDISQDQMNSFALKMTTHLEYNFRKAGSIMSTNLLSYLLLKKFRNGVRFDILVEEADKTLGDMRYRKKQIGFTGSTAAVLKRAINILGPELVYVEHENGEQSVVPVLKISSAIEMAHYAHDTFRHSMFDAVIFTAISVLFPEEFASAFKNDTELKFTFNRLYDEVKYLCDILQYDCPFKESSSDFEEALLRLCNDDLIIKFEKLMTEEERWGHRFARHLEMDDYDSEDDRSSVSPTAFYREDEDSYSLNLASGNSMFKQIAFYRNALKPYLDTYVVSAKHLVSLIDEQIPEQYYYKTLTTKMTSMLNENQLTYPESLSVRVMQNSVKLFAKWGVIEYCPIDGITLISLQEEYNNVESLKRIEEKITVI